MGEKVLNFDITGLKAYAGHFVSDAETLKSASGGAATAMSKLIISMGGVVYGVSYSDDFHSAEYKMAETVEQLEQFRGSKYCEVDKKILVNGQYESVYLNVVNTLLEGRLVLFIGLGCDVAALLKACESKDVNTTNLYTCSLICHGPTYKEAHAQYVKKLEKRFKSKLTFFSVRYKRGKWQPSYIHAEFANGKVYEIPFYVTEYGNAFSVYIRQACFNCPFKGANQKADVAIGDYWGIKEGMPGFNKTGVSLMITRTLKGEEIVSKLGEVGFSTTLYDTEAAVALSKRYYSNAEKKPGYEAFAKNFKEKGLYWAVIRWKGFVKYYKSKFESRKLELISTKK